jgi:hypothetical protein
MRRGFARIFKRKEEWLSSSSSIDAGNAGWAHVALPEVTHRQKPVAFRRGISAGPAAWHGSLRHHVGFDAY